MSSSDSADVRRETADRLVNLIIALLTHPEGRTREELMAHLRIDQERTFERLKDSLRRSLGVGLEEADGVYRLGAEGYAMPPLELTPDERAAVALALAEWRGSEVEALATRTKLAPLGLDGGAGEEALEVAGAATARGALDIIAAIAERRVIAFDYLTGYSGEVRRRRVEPWRLAKRGRLFYLLGFDQDRGARRVYNLSRLAGPVAVTGPGGAFTPPPPRRARQWLTEALAGAPKPTTRVRAAPAAARVLETEGAVPLGDAELRLPAADPFALAGWGGQVEVLDPPELRQAVRERLEAAAKAHHSEGREPGAYPKTAAARPRRRRASGAEHAARLVSLVSYLGGGRTVPLAELAERFSVPVETIRADLYELWLNVGRGQGGGELLDFAWSDDESEVALVDPQGLGEPLRLAPVEAITLIAALRSLEAAGELAEASAASSARAKLESALGPADAVELTLPEAPVGLGELRRGLGQRRRVAFGYVDQLGHASKRLVDPSRVFAASGHWLLAGWDLGAKAERYFRVDRMSQVVVLDAAADQHPAAARGATWSGAGQLEVDVVFAASERWRAEELEALKPPLELPGGSLQLRLGVSGPEWITRLALGGGGAIEVLWPFEIRERVRL
ncbi:MAG: WYL domain-containing protein, partial [Bifidobacteriaceae bacterium]|nr:WYL domain-containing protein [Bifidobacteriaceae bacterium]